MKLTSEIVQAIQMAANELGSQSELAEKVGVSKQNINRYISGKIGKVETETWLKLEPHIRKFLSESSQIPFEYEISSDTELQKRYRRVLKRILDSDVIPADEKLELIGLLSGL